MSADQIACSREVRGKMKHNVFTNLLKLCEVGPFQFLLSQRVWINKERQRKNVDGDLSDFAVFIGLHIIFTASNHVIHNIYNTSKMSTKDSHFRRV